MTKVIFTSDIHGNMVQYNKLASYAKEISADVIIIGGDIAPKNISSRKFISGQRRFFEKEFKNYLVSLKNELPNLKLYLMMGNDDCDANIDVLFKMDGKLLNMIHGKRLKINDDFDIVGYSYVPITPFGIKDWEKFDLAFKPEGYDKEYEIRKLYEYNLQGVKSEIYGFEPFEFSYADCKTDSIEKDLESEIYTKEPKKTIYVFHSPPDKTNLDLVHSDKHVGSYAIKEFIEKYQPLLTLHGHCHETVKVSGSHFNYIGETLSMSSGNHNVGEALEAIVLELENVKDAKLVTIR